MSLRAVPGKSARDLADAAKTALPADVRRESDVEVLASAWDWLFEEFGDEVGDEVGGSGDGEDGDAAARADSQCDPPRTSLRCGVPKL